MTQILPKINTQLTEPKLELFSNIANSRVFHFRIKKIILVFSINSIKSHMCKLDTFFRQIKSFLRFRLAFVFGLQTYYLIDFSKIYQLKGLEPKNKG